MFAGDSLLSATMPEAYIVIIVLRILTQYESSDEAAT